MVFQSTSKGREELEKMRKALVTMFIQRDSLRNKDVLQVSSLLDELILEAMWGKKVKRNPNL